MSNSDEQKKKGWGMNLNDLILGTLKPRTGKETTTWIADLSEDAIVAAQPEVVTQPVSNADIRRDGQKNQTMVGWMDALFDCFQQYEYEFNRTVAGGELVVNTERPTIVSEVVRATKFGAPDTVQFFKGRISTRYWTMLIRGQNERIEAYFMPIEKLISFNGDQSEFPRFLLMESQTVDGDLIWKIDEDIVQWSDLRAFGKRLFSSLIKVARGEMSHEEPFSGPSRKKAQAAATATAQPPQSAAEPSPDNSFNQHNPAFTAVAEDANPVAQSLDKLIANHSPSASPQTNPFGATPTSTAPAVPVPTAIPSSGAQPNNNPPKTNAFNSALASGSHPPMNAFNSALASGSHSAMGSGSHAPINPNSAMSSTTTPIPPLPGGPQSAVTPPAPAPAAASVTAPQQPASPFSTSHSGSTHHSGDSTVLDSSDMNFDQACELIHRALAKELEICAAAGAQAFATQDMAGVEKQLKRTNRIKELQGQVGSTLDDRKSRIKD